MAHEVLSNVKCYVDGFDLSGDGNRAVVDVSANLSVADVFTTAATPGTRRLAGHKDQVVSLAGYWQAGANLLDDVLFARLAGETLVTVAPRNGGAEGEVAFPFKALGAEYAPAPGPIGEPAPFAFAARSVLGEPPVRGVVLQNATRTTTGNGNGVNHGAVASGQKLYAGLHVLAASGTTPTLDVVIESDSDNTWASPITRVTFAQKTAIGAEWVTPVAGPITDTWWRARWTIGGAGPSFTLVVVMGFA